MLRHLFAGGIAAMLFCFPANADFYAGVEAYDKGDYKKAFEIFQTEALLKDDIAAARNLGNFYRLGIGVDKDMNKAFEWYKKAAEAGLDRAQYNLALLYLEGEGTEKNEEEAISWLIKAAVQDNADALSKLAELGVDVKNNTSYKELRAQYEIQQAEVKQTADGGVSIALNQAGEDHGSFNSRFKVGATKAETKKVASASSAMVAAPTISVSAGAKSGNTRAHVESYKQASRAENGFLELAKKYDLSTVGHEVKYEQTTKGAFYRLYLVGERADIEAICASMKARGEYCKI